MVMKGIFGIDQGRVSYLFLFTLILLFLMIITLGVIILKLRSPAGKGFANLAPPIEVVWTMYESALRGDIDTYLGCFMPESQLSIRDTLKSMGKDAFREYLRNKMAGVMGISIYSSNTANLNTIGKGNPEETKVQPFKEDMISLPVEMVFRERNELQVFNLKRVGNAWKIIGVSLPTLTPQPIPYGQNVNK